MKISDMNWEQVESYLKKDDRAVLPIGSTEQHAQLSLCVDYILSERVSVEAAEPLGVPVFPGVPYGVTPYFMGYPGTVSLKPGTHMLVIQDILDSMVTHGFKRIVIVNGHGGNCHAQTPLTEWVATNPGVAVRFHNWWNAPATWEAVKAIDPVASHASWMENFPWTRLSGVDYPTGQKSMIDVSRIRAMDDPQAIRNYIGDGNFGGYYQRSDEPMLDIWHTAVEETRAIIDDSWL